MPAEVTQNTEAVPPVTDAAATAATPPGQEQSAQPGDQKPPATEIQGENAAPKSALEAARRVMAKEAKPASEAKPQGETQAPPKTADDKSRVEEDDDAALPFKDHPRWKKMSSENRILKVAQEKNAEAIKALEPKAKTHEDLLTYLDSQNLGKDDFASGLTIMAAVKNDPFEAFKLLKPVMEHLESIVGVRLPADLEAQVEAGHISREYAQELMRSRGAEAVARSRLETTQQRMEREAEQRQRADQEGQVESIVTALNTIEAAWMKSDPDAAKLLPLVQKTVQANWQDSPLNSAEEARTLFENAVKEVKDRARALGYSPQARDGILPSGGAVTQQTAPIPKTSLDAARAALRTPG